MYFPRFYFVAMDVDDDDNEMRVETMHGTSGGTMVEVSFSVIDDYICVLFPGCICQEEVLIVGTVPESYFKS